MAYFQQLNNVCLICDPPFSAVPVILIMLDNTYYRVSAELAEAAYKTWFAWYGLTPMAVGEMVRDGLLTEPPPYHPCGKICHRSLFVGAKRVWFIYV